MLTDDERKTINHAADVLGPSLRDLATRLRAIAAPRVATVGELLATAPVIEARTVFGWHQMRANGDQRAWSVKTSTWSGWGEAFHAEVSFRESTLPARLVPADQADLNPSTRGDL
jgi:hypothetical protein